MKNSNDKKRVKICALDETYPPNGQPNGQQVITRATTPEGYPVDIYSDSYYFPKFFNWGGCDYVRFIPLDLCIMRGAKSGRRFLVIKTVLAVTDVGPLIVDIFGEKGGYIDHSFNPNIFIDRELDVPIEKLASSEFWYMEEETARKYGFKI